MQAIGYFKAKHKLVLQDKTVSSGKMDVQ